MSTNEERDAADLTVAYRLFRTGILFLTFLQYAHFLYAFTDLLLHKSENCTECMSHNAVVMHHITRCYTSSVMNEAGGDCRHCFYICNLLFDHKVGHLYTKLD